MNFKLFFSLIFSLFVLGAFLPFTLSLYTNNSFNSEQQLKITDFNRVDSIFINTNALSNLKLDKQNLTHYFAKGSYYSGVIDFGQADFWFIYNYSTVCNLNQGNIQIFLSQSNNGINWDSFTEFPLNETLNTYIARYIRLTFNFTDSITLLNTPIVFFFIINWENKVYNVNAIKISIYYMLILFFGIIAIVSYLIKMVYDEIN